MDMKTSEMTDAQFEAYLKKHKISGMGAFAASRNRRAGIKSQGWDPNGPRPISGPTPSKDDPVLGKAEKLSGDKGVEVFRDPINLSGKMTMPEGYRLTEIMPPGRKDQGTDTDKAMAVVAQEPPFIIDITPTFSGVMGIYRAIILDATRKGREELLPEIVKMAALSDLNNNANRVIATALENLRQGAICPEDIEAMEHHMKAVEQVKAKFQ